MPLTELLRYLYPASAPSDALVARVAALADATDARRVAPRRRMLPLVFGGGLVAAAVVAGAAFFAFPNAKPSLARTMETVSERVGAAQTVHYRVALSPKQGGTKIVYDIYQHGKSWRQDVVMDGKTFSQIQTNGLSWNVNPKLRLANFAPIGKKPLAGNINIEQIRRDTMAALRNPARTDNGMVTFRGQRLRKVTVAAPVQRFIITPPEPGQTIFYIDPVRMLPVRTLSQVREKTGWRTVATMDYDFPAAMSPSVFQIPPGYEKINLQTFGVAVGARFQKPLAEKRFASGTIALRDVQVNEDGDVFILYTNGSTRAADKPGNPFISGVSDNLGTSYAGTAGAIDPFMKIQNDPNGRGIVVGSETMQGVCMVPATPPVGKWKPRTFRIAYRFVEKVAGKPTWRDAAFTVPVTKPSSPLLPTYGADLAKLQLLGGDAAQFRNDRVMARRGYYSNKRDWHNLLRVTDGEVRAGTADTNTYLDRAEAFRALGDSGAAKAALDVAERADKTGSHADAIRRQREQR